MSITNVYIDGFNLYYRALKGTPYKWLDLGRLSQRLVPGHQVSLIRYFTAEVGGSTRGEENRTRQRAYIRALQTTPGLSIHYGIFRTRRKRVFPTQLIPGIAGTIEVWDTEEKGTDVNLSSYLLMDGFKGLYEQALVVTNDSDFALAIRMVRDELSLPVGVVNPNTDLKSYTPSILSEAATFQRRIRENTLKACQFPQSLTDSAGLIEKPGSW